MYRKPTILSRTISLESSLAEVLVVGFSRIALGAHFLTDVLAALFSVFSGSSCEWFLENPSDEEPLLQRFQSLAECNYSAE